MDGFESDFDSAFKELEKLKSTLTQPNNWISTKDGLPERITNKVIVYCKNGYIGFGHYEKYNGTETWYNLESQKPFSDWDIEDCEVYEVTHWMPLPEPPIE